MTTEGLSRRNALAGAATVGIGLPLLAACSGDSDDTANDPSTSGGASGAAASGTALGPTADIPVGGGTVFKEEKVVVTQPTKGDFKGFTAICTHQGCPVADVADGTINCPCHNSKFSIEDGSVAIGPATSPLAAIDLTVKGGEISLA